MSGRGTTVGEGAPPAGVLEYRRPGIGRPKRPKRIRGFGEEAGKAAALAAVFVYYGLHGPAEKGAGFFFFAGALAWLGIAVAVARRWRQRPRWQPFSEASVGWMVWVVACLIGTLISASLFDSRYSCPHGRRWTNNVYGIAWSDNGGPCGNGPHPRGRAVWRVLPHWYIYLPISP